MNTRLSARLLPLLAAATLPLAQAEPAAAGTGPWATVAHLQDYQAIEFRRYTIKDGQRRNFARYFESWFPEAFEQLGAIAFGQFFEEGHAKGFTWLRGFHTIQDRAIANAAFYYGPLWREHRETLNALIDDSDNVLLLTPLSPERGVPVLPAVDPVKEEQGAQGVAVAQLFAVQPGQVEAFAHQAEATFAAYRETGLREAGVLVTLDVANNFPQLPVRSDGPYLLWLGLARDRPSLDAHFTALAQQATQSLQAGGLLRGAPELIVLDPAPRSRLRWLAD